MALAIHPFSAMLGNQKLFWQIIFSQQKCLTCLDNVKYSPVVVNITISELWYMRVNLSAVTEKRYIILIGNQSTVIRH